MTEQPNDGFRDIHELIRKLLEQSFQAQATGPVGYGFKIVIKDGECHMQPIGGGTPQHHAIHPKAEVHMIGDEVHIIADLPGIDETEIRLTLSEGSLLIEGIAGERKYRSVVDLPPVDSSTMTYTCKNGVLDVAFKKIQKKSGRIINID